MIHELKGDQAAALQSAHRAYEVLPENDAKRPRRFKQVERMQGLADEDR